VPPGSEGFRFKEAVAGFPILAERALAAGGGPGEVGHVVLGVLGTVLGMPFGVAVVGFGAQRDWLGGRTRGPAGSRRDVRGTSQRR
jgi:hypothetical protein